MCSTVWCSFFQLAYNQNGKAIPPSSVRVSCDSTAIAYDVTAQAETFAKHLAFVVVPTKVTPKMACVFFWVDQRISKEVSMM